MTNKQKMYLDLCREGYSVEEIADMTRRPVYAVRETLAKAVSKDCMTPENCQICAFEPDCKAIKRLIASASGHKVYRRMEPVRGRYSY